MMKSDRKVSFGEVVLDSNFPISEDEGSILEQMHVGKYLFYRDLQVKKLLKSTYLKYSAIKTRKILFD